MTQLASWNDGAARTAVLDYLTAVEAAGVPDAERLAVFDNDGTLWCEKPGYMQAFFLLDAVRTAAADDPELAAKPVTKALLAGDLGAAMQEGIGPLGEVLLGAHAGITTEAFDAAVEDWLAGFRHPQFGTPFSEVIYAPMIELLELLRAHRFRTFIVTGGGVDFVRVVGTELYGVERDDIVGSAVKVEVESQDGKLVLVRSATLDGPPNEGPPKVTAIHQHLGRRPIFAAGNSAGDTEMLQFTAGSEQPSLCLVVDHDDAEREYAYPGAAMTNPNAEPISETAAREGWTIVSMQRDWSRIFP